MMNDAAADLVFEVNGRQIRCHKKVLAARSQYLAEYLEKNKGSAKICISNVPYEACETVLAWMHSGTPVETIIEGKKTLPKVQKIWELGLRFAIPEIVAFCADWLSSSFAVENICVLITILYKYTGLPVGVEVLCQAFKKNCFAYLKANLVEVQKTPSYFAMMGVSQKIKRDVENMMAQITTPTPTPVAGPAMTPPPLPQPQLQHSSSVRKTPSKGTAALLSKLKEQPPQPLPISATPPRAGSTADIDEPVYDMSRDAPNLPVFYRPDGSRKSGDGGIVATPGGSTDDRWLHDRSLTPQPPVSSVTADVQVTLSVEDCTVPLSRGTRLATCVEAHGQRKHLKTLMDSIDGGFLASFQLEDGKVEGPGYGIPLRFATGGHQTKCVMRVVVGKVPQPLTSSLSRLPPLTPPVKEEKQQQLQQQQMGSQQRYDTEKDSLILKHYKLQQEVRVTSHELELFKNDYLDWETSMHETNHLRKIEEQKLRQRIMQQKRQLMSSMYSEMEGMGGETASQGEKQALNVTIQKLRNKKESAAVAAAKNEIEKVKEEIAQLASVRDLIQTEVVENNQYEEYSKSYVCAVKQADQELRSFLPKNQSAEALRDLLAGVAMKKQQNERQANTLRKTTMQLKRRISQECNHIKHIRSFLDQT